MTEQSTTPIVQPGYEGIGPVRGLIRADHQAPIPDEWWERRSHAAGRWVVPGLWPWGHVPLLTGQPKVGKTSLVVDLVASLLISGRRFLDHFESSGLTSDDLGRGIVLINAETPVDALVEELMTATEDAPATRPYLDPIHLEQEGGAAVFDLTDPGLFDRWAHQLTSCLDCNRSDDWTPSVVIVDGLTAVLQASGKGVDHYGLWYAAFRQLMIELRVPNALVVGHSTLTGNHSMGGTEALAGPDGLWMYASDAVDNPRAVRRFSVAPRLGGEVVQPLRVVRDDSGRLVVPRQSAEASDAESVDDEPDGLAVAADEVRAKLREAWSDGLRKTDVTGSGSWGKVKRKALAQLVASGEVIEKAEGQGFRYWLAEAVPS